MQTVTPYFPDEMYNDLPDVLKEACSIFTNRRERDLYLISQLTTLSGLFPNVYGIYRNKRVSIILFTFIIAPPASGKGSMIMAKYSVSKIDISFFDGRPIDAKFNNSVFISGNTSASAFINKLSFNFGIGILFESEADTVSQNFKTEWGGFEDLLRKAFSGEEFNKSRVGDSKEITIRNPKLAVCLSGTPNQLSKFIPSVEDGLFSRFMYYIFMEETDFEDPRPRTGIPNLELFFDKIGDKLHEIFKEIGSDEICVTLQDEAWDALFVYMKEWDTYVKPQRNGFTSVVKRYGLMLYRITALLSLIRMGENKTPIKGNLVCTMKDFYTASHMINILLQHAQVAINTYTKSPEELLPEDLLNLHSLLPARVVLTKADIDKCWGYRFSPRTSYIRINALITNYLLRKVMNNKYIVVPLSAEDLDED